MTSPLPADGRFGHRVYLLRFVLLSMLDATLWLVALAVAADARLGFSWNLVDKPALVVVAFVAIDVHLLTGITAGLYTGRRRLASFEETVWLAAAAAAGTTAGFVVSGSAGDANLVPLSAVLAAGAYQLIGALAVRYAGRLVLDWRRPRSPRSSRMLIFGAGEAGSQTARALLRDAQSDVLPVAFLDDDPSKAGLRTQGLRVVGRREDIEAAASRLEADSILIAMPSAPHEAMVDVADRAQRAGLTVRVLPRLSRIVEDGIRVRDIREMTLADFLERAETRLDLDQIAGYLQGKRVLVTGAGGSIGSELCETICRFEPARLLMLDHSENNLHRLSLRMHGSGSLDSPDLILADIRDPEALRVIFERQRPQVVFHAAAHKHVPFLEAHPAEAIKTNVFGTLNVLVAAAEVGVERFVNISTDKAADPINMLGITKRIGERFTAHFAPLTSGVFMSVRFGNVLGSDGSVIPTFREQILQGRPLTVTHPEATRYFMTIPEAVQLVVQAGAIGGDGTVLVLEMGEPVKILDLAHRLSAQLRPGWPVNIEMIGLRPGEKLHESLFSASDKTIDKPHEQLWRCEVPPLSPSLLDETTTPEQLAELVDQPALASGDR